VRRKRRLEDQGKTARARGDTRAAGWLRGWVGLSCFELHSRSARCISFRGRAEVRELPPRSGDVTGLEPFRGIECGEHAGREGGTYVESLGTETDLSIVLDLYSGNSFGFRIRRCCHSRCSRLLRSARMACEPRAHRRGRSKRYRWGVGRYVAFLESWSFVGTGGRGTVAAI